MELILHYIPYVLLFALATALIYAWGLWRTMRQQQDLSNLLSAKGVAKIKKALRKNGAMTRRDLEPAVSSHSAGSRSPLLIHSSFLIPSFPTW